MKDYYYEECKECEYNYHCYGKETVIEIQEGTTNMYKHPSKCNNFYPEIKM